MLTSKKQSRQVIRNQNRKNHKILRNQENAERQAAIKIKSLLKIIFSEEVILAISKKTKFSQRNSWLRAIPTLSVLMMGCSDCSEKVPIATLTTMISILRKWFDVNVTVTALKKKINRKETVHFIKECVQLIMKYEINKVLKKLWKRNKLNTLQFSRILLQDSSIISLPATVSKFFPGCGGGASKAAVKWDFIIDQLTHTLVRMKSTSGRIPDAALSSDIIDEASTNDLIIRDLGYFNLKLFEQIIDKEAFLISRLSQTPYIYLNKDDENPIDLIKHLKKLNISKKNIDIVVYVGKTSRLRLRLIAIKVPEAAVQKRKDQYRKGRNKVGGIRTLEPSQSNCEWFKYTIMITNIDKNRLSLSMILKIYKIRWQIELFFKNMKSNIDVDNYSGTNKYRILVFVYIKLMLTCVINLLYAYAQTLAAPDEEISLDKFTKWLKRVLNFKEMVIAKDLSVFTEELIIHIDLLYKQKRKKKTTANDIEDSYLESKIDLKAS